VGDILSPQHDCSADQTETDYFIPITLSSPNTLTRRMSSLCFAPCWGGGGGDLDDCRLTKIRQDHHHVSQVSNVPRSDLRMTKKLTNEPEMGKQPADRVLRSKDQVSEAQIANIA
jgi:hypothetical protein